MDIYMFNGDGARGDVVHVRQSADYYSFSELRDESFLLSSWK